MLKEAAAVTKRMGINAIANGEQRNCGRWVRGNKYGVIYEQVRRDFDGEGINCHQIRGGIVVLILVRNAFR
jgi:hypothetical protein